MEATRNFFKTVSDAAVSGSRQAGSAVGQAVGDLGGSVESYLSSARQVFNKPKGLQEWATQQAEAAGNQEMKTWLEKMSAKDWGTLNKAILDFSASLHFRPEWFWEPELAKDLPLENVFRGALMTFVEAFYQVYKVQADIDIFNNWLAWTKHPGKHPAKTRQLFAALYRQQRVTVTDDFITMSAKQQDKFMVEAIRKARVEDGNAFLDVFKETFGPAPVVEPASAPEPPAVVESIPVPEPLQVEISAEETPAAETVEDASPDTEQPAKRSRKP